MIGADSDSAPCDGLVVTCSQLSQQSSAYSCSSQASRASFNLYSTELQEVVRGFRVQQIGTGKGGPRISLFEKWTRFRQGAVFPESDLQWVLVEFQRAATHARSYWEKYDARVRRYILQHTNAECLRRIGKWKGKGNRVAVGAVGGPLLMQAPLSDDLVVASVAITSTTTTATAASSSSSSSSSSSNSDLNNVTPSAEQEHDWTKGRRFGLWGGRGSRTPSS